jgi:hypothetical protein
MVTMELAEQSARRGRNRWVEKTAAWRDVGAKGKRL